MKTQNTATNTIDQIVSDGVNRNILHLYTEDNELTGNYLTLKGKSVVNFGSCSYLGLEFDERLKKNAIEAIQQYGTQFSESRAYVSIKLYKDLEEKFEKIFHHPVVVTPTTTLGHIATIPVIMEENDAVILDHQVHNSVQTACQLLKAKGIHTELLRHNRIDLLEKRIIELKSKHEKIWYMADGIYSMFGDVCPIDEIKILLDKYPEFHLYVDDAHGMSCYGENGEGYVLSKLPHHDKMIVATSLAKAFATGGAVIIFPNKEWARKVRTCGGPMITSGPIQPAVLGAANASAEIHLTNEIQDLQRELQDKIMYTHFMLQNYGLPVLSNGTTPVFFVGVSLPKIGYRMVEEMLEKGYYVNLGIFPAVPMRNTGVRFTITRLHTFEQIDQMIGDLKKSFDKITQEEGITLNQIYKAFKLNPPIIEKAEKIMGNSNLQIELKSTIHEMNPSEWNQLLGKNGTYDFNGMVFLEKCFTQTSDIENNWKFRYLIIRDEEMKPIFATFFTSCLWKDDMLSPNEISIQVEEERIKDKYYMTSKVLMTGSLFTEGDHFFINEKHPLKEKAIQAFFNVAQQLQEDFNASYILLRDFNQHKLGQESHFIDNGFFKINMPDNHHVEMNEYNYENWMEKLSPRSRKHLRQDIIRHEDKFIFKIEHDATAEQIEYWYELYLNVKNRSYELNTFRLPKKLFYEMALDSNWQVSTLYLKNESISENQNPVAVMFTYLNGDAANFMLIGIDYTTQKEFHTYRQALYRVMKYNFENSITKINLGFAASFEKRKLGADIIPTWAYMQMKDNFEMQNLDSLNGVKAKSQINLQTI